MNDDLMRSVEIFGETMKKIKKAEYEKNEFDNGYASIFLRQLGKAIYDFDKELNNTEEVGVRLVSYGQSIQFHITDLKCTNPYLIHFYGVLEDGSPVQLIQHVSQISFVLIKMKRKNPSEPKRRIGFAIE